jgi:hypothetical protein
MVNNKDIYRYIQYVVNGKCPLLIPLGGDVEIYSKAWHNSSYGKN